MPKRKNNPLLLGDSGVGKTAIIEGLALKIVNGDVPPALKNAKVFSLDMAGLVAGTRFRGDFEERFKNILKDLEAEEKAILFIDEAHIMVGTGSVQGVYGHVKHAKTCSASWKNSLYCSNNFQRV